MLRPSASEMLDVQMECDEIISDYYGGLATKQTLEKARDGLKYHLNAYDRGAEFGRLVVREFDRGIRDVARCAGTC